MMDETTFEERKRRYIEAVEAEHIPPEKSWWQYPPPSYHTTDLYSAQFPQPVDTEEPAIFKDSKKQGLIAVVLVIVAAVLIYIIAQRNFGFVQLLVLALLLLVVLPSLLNNKPRIIISNTGVWLFKGDKNIAWSNILLTYVKEIHQEHPAYFFIVHYYDEEADQFNNIEVELEDIVSPQALAATVEKFRQPTINSGQ